MGYDYKDRFLSFLKIMGSHIPQWNKKGQILYVLMHTNEKFVYPYIWNEKILYTIKFAVQARLEKSNI